MGIWNSLAFRIMSSLIAPGVKNQSYVPGTKVSIMGLYAIHYGAAGGWTTGTLLVF